VIAQKFKVSNEALLKLNHIDDPKKLKPGQKLRIPAPGTVKT
jgi:LysM repeat protein